MIYIYLAYIIQSIFAHDSAAKSIKRNGDRIFPDIYGFLLKLLLQELNQLTDIQIRIISQKNTWV